MNFDPNIKARLVYDGGSAVTVPEEMGIPLPKQMQGTTPENLIELCGRVCYDSLGNPKSRDSAAYFKHILEVKHLSVCEHFAFTVEFDSAWDKMREACANRLGVLSYIHPKTQKLHVTANIRSIIEWDLWTRRLSDFYEDCTASAATRVGVALAFHANQFVPNLVELPMNQERAPSRVVAPANDHERFISIFQSGSRCYSHEQVRHRKAISQRSTRYCDESASPFVEHPLYSKYMAEVNDAPFRKGDEDLAARARCLYDAKVERMQNWLLIKGVDKLTARKQARGAARGSLLMNLATEMIFTDSVWGWRNILTQRTNPAADAEIRVLYNYVLPELKKSRYADRFADIEMVESKDGLGLVLGRFVGW